MSFSKQSGFTLIELLIVVLIIGILAAVALPVFNGQRNKAKNSVVQSNLRNALSAVQAAYVNNGDSFAFADSILLANAISAEESSIKTKPGATSKAGSEADPQSVFVYRYSVPTTPNVQGVTLCGASKGDSIYCVRQLSEDGVLKPATFARTTGDYTANVLAGGGNHRYKANGWDGSAQDAMTY